MDKNEIEPADQNKTPRGSSVILFATIKVLFNWLIVPAALVLFLHFFVFQAYQVLGTSMLPTLHNGDYLVISKIGPSIAKLRGGSPHHAYYIPKRGDVIVFIAPPSPTQTYVKRVVGLPGEHVVVKNGKITVFNLQHPSGFNPDSTHQVSTPITLGNDDLVVPSGDVYAVGDNRLPHASFDSRDWGPLPTENIIGTARLRLWPAFRFLALPTFTQSLRQLL